MNPLLFANWQEINALFRGLMWLVAVGLAVVVLAQSLPSSSPARHHSHSSAALSAGVLANK